MHNTLKLWLHGIPLLFFFALLPLQAQKLTHYIPDKASADYIEDAAGLKITDDGQVYVTSTKKGTLLLLQNDSFHKIPLKPDVFGDTDLAGIDQLADGRLVIVNSGSHRIAILDKKAENLLIKFSRKGGDAGELDDALGLAVSVNNKIYVADKSNNRISVFNDQGLFLKAFGQYADNATDLSRPTHIALDADENVYVLESGDKNRVSIYKSTGELIRQLDSAKMGEMFGARIDFSAMTADQAGTLYLADENSRKILVYNWHNDVLLNSFGSLGQSRGQYRAINQLSVNIRGQLAVLDRVNKKLEIYQLDEQDFKQPLKTDVFKLSAKTDSNCNAQQAFLQQQTLCLRKGKGIFILNENGKEVGQFGADIKDPIALHSGTQIVAILEKNLLHAYTPGGEKIYSIGRYGTAAGAFDGAEYVFSAHNRVYVGDVGNQRIQIFAGDGQFVGQIKASDKSFSSLGPFAVDSHQNIYIADQDSKGLIKVLDSAFHPQAVIGDDPLIAFRAKKIHALDIDKKNRLFALVSTARNDYSVRMYDELRLTEEFGAGENNGTEVFFETVGSLSVFSGEKIGVLINDTESKKLFKFDYLEYPDAAYGLRISGNSQEVLLEWESSHSPVIAEYEIQAAANELGPFQKLASTQSLNYRFSVEQTRNLPWYRVVSISGHQLAAKPSAARENLFYRLDLLYRAEHYQEVIELAERLLKLDQENADILQLKAHSQLLAGQRLSAINSYRQLEKFPQYKKSAIYQQVKAYYELEQYLEAKALIDQVLAQKPEEADAYLICAEISLRLSDAIGAVGCAEDGLSKHPQHVDLRYLLGKAYILAAVIDQGLEEFQSAIDLQPANYAIRLKIADQLMELKRYADALNHYQVVSAALPASAAATIGEANSLLKLDRDEEAKAIAIKLSADEATKGDGYYVLGKIAFKQEKYTEAVLRLTRAGKLNPANIDGWQSLAQAYVEINKPAEAVTSLSQGISANPEAFLLYQQAGQIELSQENYNAANQYLETAVALNAQSLAANRLYARSLYATRNYRTASLYAERAAKIAPKDIDVLTLQADIANQQGKVGSAIEYLKTAINLQPASAELQHQLGRVYLNANLFDASREHLEKAAAISPAWAEPVLALGQLLSKRRLFDEAIVAFERAVELSPSDDNRALLNAAFADKKKSLEFANNAPQLVLSDLNLKHVFSAAYKKYAEQSLGSVNLKNVSATDYGNLELSFQIKEYMDFPVSQKIDQLAGNTSKYFDFKVTFNNKILDVDEDIGVQVEVRLSFQRDGKTDSIRLTQPMTIYGKNAMVWGDANMVGSFVTPKDDTLRDYVRRAINNYQPAVGPLNDKLVSAMTYFSALTAAGTRYSVDPNTPYTTLRDDQVDYVQFPRETLKLKSGDCDDLSVLLSAGLENLGIETALIEVPGHLFMMFNTGLLEPDASLISQNRSLLVIRDQQIWIPLEATMVNASFTEAWAEGARKYHAALADNTLNVIDLKKAWEQYRPVTLAKASYTIEDPDKQQALALVKTAQTQLLSKSVDRLILPYQTMIANNPGNINARLQVAILYSRYGLYDDAQQVFDVLHELAPENSAVHSNQGNLYLLSGGYDKALASYRQAIKLDDKDGGIWLNLSMANYRKGDVKTAAADYQQAVSLTPELNQQYSAYSKLLSQ